MKIAFVCNDITTRGGIERVTSNLASLFAEKGNDVTIISLYKENEQPAFPINRDVKIAYLNSFTYLETKGILKGMRSFLKTTILLKRYCNKHLFDVIIAQATRASMHCLFANLNRKTISSEHFKYGLYSGYKLKIRNWLYKKFACVAVLTANDNKKFQSASIPSFHIPNMGPATISLHLPSPDSKKIVSLGRLHPQKGFDLLIKAAHKVTQKYPDWKFEIYGEGDELKNLENLISKYDLSNNVLLKGYSSNLDQSFNDATFYVMSSRYEGFPMCLLEAASYNLPIVSYNCPEGPSELLKNNAGLLIEPEDIDKLSEGIIYMIEHPAERAAMARRGLDNLKEYSPENIYAKWVNAFDFVKHKG